MRTALPALGGFEHLAVKHGFGADVNAAGGFVEQEDVGVLVEEAAEGDFLLVAAGEGADGLAADCARTSRRWMRALGGGELLGARDEAVFGERRRGGRG